MQSRQTIKDMQGRDRWLKAHGYNPATFFNPDVPANLIRAHAIAKQLLRWHRDCLTAEQVHQLLDFQRKPNEHRMYRVLNLGKKVRRQLHRALHGSLKNCKVSPP